MLFCISLTGCFWLKIMLGRWGYVFLYFSYVCIRRVGFCDMIGIVCHVFRAQI